MGKLIIDKQSTLVERGTSENQWIIGSRARQKIYLKASQPGFDPYLVFDPETVAWYAVATPADERAFLAETLTPISGGGGGGGEELWSQGEGTISPYDNSIHVGVGTTNPNSLFTVNQQEDTTPGVGNPSLYGFSLTNQSSQIFSLGNDSASSATYMQTWNNQSLVINHQGNPVGIGTNTPSYHLDVNGAIRASDYITTPRITNNQDTLTIDADTHIIFNAPIQYTASTALGYVLTSDGDGFATWQAPTGDSPWQVDSTTILQKDDSFSVYVSGPLSAGSGISLAGNGGVRQTLWLAGEGDYNHAICNNSSQASGYDYSQLTGNSFGNNDGEVFFYDSFLAFQNRAGTSAMSYFDTAGDFHVNGNTFIGSNSLDTNGVQNFFGSGLDDVSWSTFPYNGGVPATFTVACIATDPGGDTFSLSNDAGLGVASPLTPSPGGNSVGFGYGIQINFGSGVGHTIGDFWTITFAEQTNTYLSVGTSGVNVSSTSLKFQSGATIAQGDGQMSIDPNNWLLNKDGVSSVDWGARQSANSSGAVTLDWHSCRLLTGGVDAVHWGNRNLTNSAGSGTVDWENCGLATSGIARLDWRNGILIDMLGDNGSLDWNNRALISTNGTDTVLNWGTQEMKHSSGTTTINWQNQYLANENGYTAFSWNPMMMANTTAARPVGLLATGFQYFDTDLDQPIWWNGSDWKTYWSEPLTSTITLTPLDLADLSNYPGALLVSGAALDTNQGIVWESIEFLCDLTSGTPYTTTANFYMNISGNYSGGQKFPAGDTPENGNIGLLTAAGRKNRRFVFNTTPDMQIQSGNGNDLLLMADGAITGGTESVRVRVTYRIVDMLT